MFKYIQYKVNKYNLNVMKINIMNININIMNININDNKYKECKYNEYKNNINLRMNLSKPLMFTSPSGQKGAFAGALLPAPAGAGALRT